MSIEHRLHVEFRGAQTASNALPLRQDNAPPRADTALPGDDAFLAALSPLLEEADGLRGDSSSHEETRDFLRLLEENARLRRLAVRLSNLLGDLPVGDAPEIAPGSSKSP